MPMNGPLFPAFSPSEGEKEKRRRVKSTSINSDWWRDQEGNPLSPSDGERVRERGLPAAYLRFDSASGAEVEKV
jgi:hypothetical protein